MSEPVKDLGEGHIIAMWEIAGSDEPWKSQRIGAIIGHTKADGAYCEGGVHWGQSQFAIEHPDRLTEFEQKNVNLLWTLVGDLDGAFTLTPSLLCSCGDHGFIRDGKWVRA